MLLARMSPDQYNAGRLTLPGGGLNWGEAPADAVLLELEEETGLLGGDPELAGVFSGVYARTPERPLDPVHHISVLYVLETLPGELRYEQDGSTDMCAWIPLEDLAQLPLVPLAEYGCKLALAAG